MVVDSLEVEVQSKADSAVKSLDIFIQRLGLICEGISAIGKSSGLDDFAKQTREATKGLDGFRDAAKNIQSSIEPQMKKVAKSFEEITERYKDLGKGFRFEGSTSAIQKQIDKYSNSLETAKLKKQELEASGNVNGEQYEKAVRDVIKYSNIVESLKNQLKELESVKIENPIKDLSIEEFAERAKTQIQQSLDGLRIENPISVTEMSDEQLQVYKALAEEMEEARRSLSVVDEEMQKVGESAEALGGKAREAAKAITYNADAMQMVYGKENAGIQNFQQALDKFGVKTGSQLGAELSDSLNDVQKKAEILQKRLSELVVPEIKEDNLQKLESELKKTEALTDQLRAKLSNEITMGRITESVDDTKFVKLSEQIALSEKQAEALRQKISEVGNASETADTSGIERQKQSMSSLATVGKRVIAVFSGIRAALSKLGSAVDKALSGFGKLTKSILSVGKASKKTNGSFGLSLKTVLKYAFGIRSLFVLFNRLRSAIKEGMKNLIQYSDETNTSVSTLKSSLNQLKNASAAAASPLLNAIAPALNQLIQLFIRATNAVNQFLSALMGRSTWIKAKFVYEDVGESIKDASKAAKGALQPFDKLNNLTSQQAESGGIDPGDMFETVPIEKKFKDLIDRLKDMWKNADFYDLGKFLGDKLAEALAKIPWDKIKETAGKLGKSLATLINGFINGEFDGISLGWWIGHTLAEAINTGFKFFNDFVHNLDWAGVGKFIADTFNGFFQSIDWDLIYDTFVTGAKGLADAINSFVDNLDWDAIASTIANLVNTFSATILTFFNTVDWSELGAKVGESLSKAIKEIDFENVGRALGSVIQAGIDFLKNLLSELSFEDITGAITDLFKGFFEEADWTDVATVALTLLAGALIMESPALKLSALALTILSTFQDELLALDWGKAGEMVSKAFIKFFDFITTTIESVDWWQVGEKVKEFLVGVDWGGVAEAFFEAIGAALGGLAAFLGGLLANAVADAGDYFQTKIEEAGGNIVEGILVGICEALVGIGEWIKEHIFKPFLEGFQKAFEIHSPSKVMQDLGTQIIQGLLNGLKEKWKDITDWLSNKLQWIKDKLSGAANSVKSAFSGGGGWFGGGSQKTSRTSTAAQSVRNSFENISLVPNVRLPKFEKGAVTLTHTFAEISEKNKPEGIIPLTDHRAMKMIADGIISQYDYGRESSTNGYQGIGQSDSLLRTLIQENRRQNQLLELLIDKEIMISTDQVGRMAEDYNEQHRKRTGSPAYG